MMWNFFSAYGYPAPTVEIQHRRPSTSDFSFVPTMEKPPFLPHTSFFAAQTQAPNKDLLTATRETMKRKIHHEPVLVTEIVNKNKASTESIIFGNNARTTKKPRICEVISIIENHTEKQSCGNDNAIVGSTSCDISGGKEFLTKNYNPQEVSTALTLFDESWSTNDSPAFTRELSAEELASQRVASAIARMKFLTPEEEQEERNKGVSTELKLFEDPWKIEKRLKGSDVGGLSRLLPFFNDDCVKAIESNGA